MHVVSTHDSSEVYTPMFKDHMLFKINFFF